MILHPFLICLYPILFLYSHNIKELHISQIIIPCLISLFITTMTYLVVNKFINNRFQVGFFTSLFIILIFYYSRCFDALQSFDIFIPSYKHYYIILYVFIFLGYLIYLLKSLSSFYLNVNKFLNILSIFLISVNLYTIITYEFKAYNNFGNSNSIIFNNEKNNLSKTMVSFENEYPDIYFIVLDEYASLTTIKNIFNYDNSEFEYFLFKKGFFLAKDSETSTSFTPAAIASILNMKRINTKDLNTCFNLIKNNKVTGFLKDKNYKIINFPMRYYENKVTPILDSEKTFKSPKKNTISQLSKFDLLLFESSILNSLYLAINNRKEDDNKAYYIDSTNFIYKKLMEIVNLKGPKFIYAHIECPHPPYVFKKNGEPLDSIKWNGLSYYLGQYIHITEKSKILIENILNRSKKSPIIILQSDHGPNQKKQGTGAYFATKEKHTKNIFNALYIPDMDMDKISSDISPEDTFKLVFKKVFNEEF